MSVEDLLGSKYLKVEKAKEWETYKNLPKFTHVPMAVIHPSPRKKKTPYSPPKANFTVAGSGAKLAVRRYEQKQIPEHLMRAPMDSFTQSYSAAPKRLQSAHPGGRSSPGGKGKRSKSRGKGQDTEGRRLKKAEDNKKFWFNEIKKLLEKNDDETIAPGVNTTVGVCKTAVKDKRLIRHFYEVISGTRLIQPMLQKQDFINMVKLIVKEHSINEIGDLFLLFCRRLEGQKEQNENDHSSTAKQRKQSEQTFNNSNKKVDPKMSSFGKNKQSQQQQQLNSQNSQKSDLDLRDIKVDLSQVDQAFAQWYNQEENLNVVLNIKIIKQKNADLRLKLDAWKKRADERKRLAKRVFQHGKKLRASFDKLSDDFNIEKEKVQQCVIEYHNLCEQKEYLERIEKTINNFLCQLPESNQILEIKDIERVLENENRLFKQELNMLRDFAQVVKVECVLNQYYFSFFDIPDLIVKKKYQRKDYELIMKLLAKVKKRYLVHKAQIIENKPLEEIIVTDEDLVPIELIDNVISTIENKNEEKKQLCFDLIQKCKQEANSKIKQLGVTSDKTKKIVENSMLAHTLNNILENNHQQIYTFHYKHQLLYLHFVVSNPMFKAAREFEAQFKECYLCEKYTDNKFYKEWKDRQTKEMLRFNGKAAGLPGELESISASSEGMRSQKAMNNQQSRPKSAIKTQGSNMVGAHGGAKDVKFAGAFGASPGLDSRPGSGLQKQIHDEMDDVVGILNKRRDSTDSLNFRDSSFDPMSKSREPLIQPIAVDPMRELAKGLGQAPHSPRDMWIDEEEQEDERRRQEEEKKKQQESQYKEFYRDQTGNHFDPNKKYGVIQDNSLIYDNVTSSYPLNLPTDYYLRYIQSTLPSKDAGKWFIRPHHLETLTEHPQSVKDDVLNTRYYSHYNQNYGKKEERNEAEEAIKTIEMHLERLRQHNYLIAAQRGQATMAEMEALEEQRDKITRLAQEEYERFIHDKTRMDAKALIIEAYEGVLYDRRRLEKELLNNKRFREFEKNRSPQDRWYELKSKEFSKELYRNRMALKPNDANRVYLQTLQDPYLY